MISVQSKGASTGVALGSLYFYQRAKSKIAHCTVEDGEAEWARFEKARFTAIELLGALAEEARQEAKNDAAALFEVQQMMAENLDYVEAIAVG